MLAHHTNGGGKGTRITLNAQHVHLMTYLPSGGIGWSYRKQETAMDKSIRVLMMIANTTGPKVLIV
jgi:hypothetical protein